MRRLRNPARCLSLNVAVSILAMRRAIEAADDIEKGGLPGTGGTGDRQPLPSLETEIDIDERTHHGLAPEATIDLADLQ